MPGMLNFDVLAELRDHRDGRTVKQLAAALLKSGSEVEPVLEELLEEGKVSVVKGEEKVFKLTRSGRSSGRAPKDK